MQTPPSSTDPLYTTKAGAALHEQITRRQVQATVQATATEVVVKFDSIEAWAFAQKLARERPA